MKVKTLVIASLLALISNVVSSQCTPPPVGCSGTDFSNSFINSSNPNTIEYDNIVSTFHSTMARQSDGRVLVWGEFMTGKTNLLSPIELNSTNFPGLTGTVLKFTGASSNINSGQFIALTTDGLYYWGDESTILSFPWTYSAVQKLTVSGQSDGLPAGVDPADVKMLFGTTHYLVIVTCGGEVWSLIDGGYWVQAKIDASTPLTGVVAARGINSSNLNVQAFMALKNDGTVWTWGKNSCLGDGTGPTVRTFATQMVLPSGITPKMIGLTLGNKYNVGGYYDGQITYYLLATNGNLYALGGNDKRQLGVFSTTDSYNWVRPLKSNSSTDYLTNIKWISPNEHDGSAGMPAINAIDGDGALWSWGYNSFNMLGVGPGAAINPTKNIGGLTTADKIEAVETGGHTTIVIKQCSGNLGYVGHYINGSMANGTDGDGNTVGLFNFTSTAKLNLCGTQTNVAFLSPISGTVYAGTTIQLSYSPSGGTFSIVSGAATVSSTGLLTLTGTAANTVVVKYTSNNPCTNSTDQITINVQKSLSVGFSTAANSFKVFGIGLMVIGALGMGMVGAKRKKAILILMVLVGTLTFYAGCAKSEATTSKEGNLFVRIAQVDKDGTKSYSKVIKVNK